MRGHKRFMDGGWRFTVEASKDPITGKRRQLNRTVRAPNTRAGAQAADVELARLIVEVSSGEAAPSVHTTVGCDGSSTAGGLGKPARRASQTGP